LGVRDFFLPARRFAVFFPADFFRAADLRRVFPEPVFFFVVFLRAAFFRFFFFFAGLRLAFFFAIDAPIMLRIRERTLLTTTLFYQTPPPALNAYFGRKARGGAGAALRIVAVCRYPATRRRRPSFLRNMP
jgi:hypothetical protein